MEQFLLNLKGQKNKYVALGGIGSGSLKLFDDGRISLESAGKDQKSRKSNGCSFFAIKAGEKNSVRDARILVTQNSDCQNACSNFEKSDVINRFPFVTKTFESEKFPAKVTLCAFNPFVPLNDTDSSIPASFFEFTVKNTQKTELDISLCAVCENIFEKAKNTMGCNEDGSFFIRITEDSLTQDFQNNNISIATDSKDISFQEYFYSSKDENVLENFRSKFADCETFVNRGIDESKENNGALICSHFSLGPDEEKTVRFVISWFFQRVDGTQKYYYSQYFGSSDECAGYCFDHWERLKNDTLKFSKTLFESTLPQVILNEINDSLSVNAITEFVRYKNGSFGKDSVTSLEHLSPVLSLFPKLARTVMLENVSEIFSLDEQDVVSTGQKLLIIIEFYKLYLADGDYEQLIENWYYISRLADDIYTAEGIKDKEKYLITTFVALRACVTMARDVRDKKRLSVYENLLFKLNLEIEDNKFYNQVTGFYHAFECGFLDIFEKVKGCTQLDVNENNKYKASHIFVARHFMDRATELLEKTENQVSGDVSQIGAFSLVNACSGFVYNRKDNHVNVNPIDYLSQDGVFKCFFCVETGYGYIERGIDYVEINMVYGTIDVRKISVPRRGRMVLYGGRKWAFDSVCDNSVVVLDNVLTVSSDKKLTVIIDV